MQRRAVGANRLFVLIAEDLLTTLAASHALCKGKLR